MKIIRKAHKRKGGPRKGYVRKDRAVVPATTVKPANVKAVHEED